MNAAAYGCSCLLLVSVGLFTSCGGSGDGREPVEVSTPVEEFWIHTETGHAKEYHITIALPLSYYATETRTYPVLYLTDADFYFGIAKDLAMVLGWPQREVIVVGIGYGSPERLKALRELEYGEAGDETGVAGCVRYREFLERRLIPRVEREYRINPHNRTFFGWSWGSALAGHMLMEHPDLFQNYIVGGGAFPPSWVDTLHRRWPELPLNLYLGIGERDGSRTRFEAFADAMAAKEFGGLQMHRDIYPEKGHEVVAVADLLDRGMKWVYAKKPLEPRLWVAMRSGGADMALEAFRRLRTTNPEDFDCNPLVLATFADSLGREGNAGAQSKCLDLLEREHPKQQVTVRVVPRVVPEFGSIYVTGNHPALGNWHPGKVTLERTDADSWSRTFSVRAGTEMEFKITRGGWDNQAADSTGSAQSNSTVFITGDTTITTVIEAWVDLQ